MNTLADVISAINASARIAVTAHIRPDGDAIGAVLGLHRLLRHAGKQSEIAGLGPIPNRYAFLMNGESSTAPEKLQPGQFDLLIVLDTGAIDRAPDFVASWTRSIPSVNIDHHPTNTAFAEINWVDATASSSGEMICTLAIAAGYAIPPDAAEALWAALLTDTGRFAHSNTTPAALTAGIELLKTGIRTDRVSNLIYDVTPLARLRLQGRAIEHLELHHQGCLALVALRREDFECFSANGADAEDIVDIPRRLHGVHIALFLYELPGEEPRQTKISFRTSAPFDAAQLCRELGGGGHARAAGCSLDMPLADAKTEILSIIRNAWFSE